MKKEKVKKRESVIDWTFTNNYCGDFQKLDKKMLTSISKQNQDLNSYDKIKAKTKKVNNNLVDVGGMEEDANLDMISKNIQNTVWTAAVIIGVVVAIKLSR